jgi:hypothetical protein
LLALPSSSSSSSWCVLHRYLLRSPRRQAKKRVSIKLKLSRKEEEMKINYQSESKCFLILQQLTSIFQYFQSFHHHRILCSLSSLLSSVDVIFAFRCALREDKFSSLEAISLLIMIFNDLNKTVWLAWLSFDSLPIAIEHTYAMDEE